MAMDGTGSPSAAHLLHVPTRPAPITPAPVAPPTYAPSQPQPGASAGPDGPLYVVLKGHLVGVFRGWENVSTLVTGVGHACFFRHGTRASAQAAFDEALTISTMEVLY
ncbi:hypothetical protein IW261DRAFT_1571721 [Armillaria novae-zelandiae]|uniref:Ribonuclease H1 N-terminal domain-containing protein n=1 Tax=Armillaria novae-zelandiae TaxID=153914 RepID=A0AA39NUF0_9AGAR|nr:hypothetical protein IW261DRAFT_1571721 [Armillaria novae-zelandiae]